MGCAYALARLFRFAWGRLPRSWAERAEAGLLPRLGTCALALAAAIAAANLLPVALGPRPAPYHAARETSIIRRLEAEIGIRPGAPFRGRCLSLLGSGVVTEAGQGQGARPGYSARSEVAPPGFGNTHMESDLWIFGIPTLEGYDQSTSVPFYLTYSRAASAAPWMVNHTCISRLNLPLFRAAGVRFLIAPRQLDEPGLRLATYMTHAGERLQAEAGAAPGEYPAAPPPDAQGHFLYELDGANLANWSPQAVTRLADAPRTLERMADPGFDPSRELLVFAADLPQGGLAPLASSVVEIRRGGIRLRAASAGTSVLLLPFQYSRTMRWEPGPDGSEGSAPLAVACADMYMTAVFFEKRLDGVLRLDAGFGWARGRRLDDYLDMRRLNILDVPRRDLAGDDRWFK
jgi:hypothetical protein